MRKAMRKLRRELIRPRSLGRLASLSQRTRAELRHGGYGAGEEHGVGINLRATTAVTLRIGFSHHGHRCRDTRPAFKLRHAFRDEKLAP